MAFRDMFKATEYKQRVEELESMLTPEMADADRLRHEAEDLRKKIEDKQKDEIFSALIASGKTVEEVMKYLKSGNEEKAE